MEIDQLHRAALFPDAETQEGDCDQPLVSQISKKHHLPLRRRCTTKISLSELHYSSALMERTKFKTCGYINHIHTALRTKLLNKPKSNKNRNAGGCWGGEGVVAEEGGR